MNFQSILDIIQGRNGNSLGLTNEYKIVIYLGGQNARLLPTLLENLAMNFLENFREVDHDSLEQLERFRRSDVYC